MFFKMSSIESVSLYLSFTFLTILKEAKNFNTFSISSFYNLIPAKNVQQVLLKKMMFPVLFEI